MIQTFRRTLQEVLNALSEDQPDSDRVQQAVTNGFALLENTEDCDTGIQRIDKERCEQILKHCWTPESDINRNSSNQLLIAAGVLQIPDGERNRLEKSLVLCPAGWDLKMWAKMIDKPHVDRLVIAGACVAAEIDRLLAIANQGTIDELEAIETTA